MANGIKIVYSSINMAWFVMWYDEVLRLFNTKQMAYEYAKSLEV